MSKKVAHLLNNSCTFTKIKPPPALPAPDLVELWNFRELLLFLAWRDISVRYKQTIIGIAWAIIQPLLTMVVFSFIFGRLAKVPSFGVPYPIFSYTALLPWQYFAAVVTACSGSLVLNNELVNKVYFPRLLLPLASTIPPIVDFFFAFLVLLLLMLLYQVYPLVSAFLLLPALLLLVLITALGFGIWAAALNALYRDVKYLIPFIVQLWMFVSPVVYSAKQVPGKLRIIYYLNPLAGAIEGFRWALLGQGEINWMMFYVSVSVAIAIFISGLFFFQKLESSFADRI